MPITTPGFWDLHLHGVGGIDFMHADRDGMVHACELLGRNGTGYFAPTLLTAEPSLLREACRRWGAFLAKANKAKYLPKHAATPLGLHLEGPFLNAKMAGAHPTNHLKKPSPGLASELIQLALGHVAIVTLSPELPGAMGLIAGLHRKKIRVQLGHTLATTKEAQRAVGAGATGLTHLYNAMKIHHRDPGALSALSDPRVTAEIITDGIHLAPEFILWCRQAAKHQLYAVSDGCSAIGCRPRERLSLGSLAIERVGNAAVTSAGILAGGATYLKDHPAVLMRALGDASQAHSLLELFYKTQSRLIRPPRRFAGQNHFDSKTLHYLGSAQ